MHGSGLNFLVWQLCKCSGQTGTASVYEVLPCEYGFIYVAQCSVLFTICWRAVEASALPLQSNGLVHRVSIFLRLSFTFSHHMMFFFFFLIFFPVDVPFDLL